MPLYYGNIAANGITVTNNGAASVPSTIVSAAAQTSDFFDVTYSGGTAGQMFSVIPASSTTQTNGVQIQTSASGGFPLLKTVGSDGNIALAILAKGAGNIAFGQAPTNYQLNMGQVANAVDYITISGAATANPATLTIAATGSDTNVGIKVTCLGTGGTAIQGTGTNDNAAASFVGEFVQGQLVSGSATSLSTGTSKTVTSISLTAGDWNVWGVVDIIMTGATVTNMKGGTNTTTNTLGGQDTFVSDATNYVTDTDTNSLIAPMTRYSLSTTTTVFLIAQSTFSVGTCTAYGTINARRVR